MSSDRLSRSSVVNMLALPDSRNRHNSHQPVARRQPAPQPTANPFHDDFFSPALRGFDRDPFGSMNSIMEQMNSFANGMFRQMDSHFADLARGLPSFPTDGLSRSYVKTITSSTKYDRNGQPITEKYESTAVNVRDHDGTHVGERKQAYMNSGSGLQKLAVERKLGDRSRKVIQEKVQGHEARSDLYRNMDERDVEEFDRAWHSKGHQLGFASSNALPAPSGSIYGAHVMQRQHRDEGRRGEYVPDYMKQDHQPVRVNREVQPTIPIRALPQPDRHVPQGQNLRQPDRQVRQPRVRPASRHSAMSGG